MKGMLGLRIGLAVLGGVLGLLLISRGNVVIGGIILVMAVLRGVMIVRLRSLRDERRAAVMARVRQRRG